MSHVWVLTDRRYMRQRMPAALLEWLDRQGRAAQLLVADAGGVLSRLAGQGQLDRGFAWDRLAPGDVVVSRTRHPFGLALLREAEARGACVIDGWAAVVRVRNKLATTLALAAAGVPVPETFAACRPAELRVLSPGLFPLLLKPVRGDNARGIRLVRRAADLAQVAWPEELVLAQPYLDAGGVDIKVYVAGEDVWAVHRPSPLLNGSAPATIEEVTPGLRCLADACRAATGLRLLGVDVLETESGARVVDVNEFPNYTGVEEAPEAIGRLVLAAADREIAAAEASA